MMATFMLIALARLCPTQIRRIRHQQKRILLMANLSNSELRRLDLTLLLVFLGLLRHRKASTVADELGLTQSAISQGLKRLREIFSDELFLRRPHGMEPTATALALEPSLSQAVERIRVALDAARAFDPLSADGIINVAALDAEQAVIIPKFAARLRQTAPGLRLSVLPLGRGDAMDALNDGRVELVFGFLWNVPGHITSFKLYEDNFLVAGRPKALPQAPHISLENYCSAEHVLIAPGGDLRGVVDDRLESMGRSRKVVLGLPAFLPALAAVASSNTLVTLPARVASGFAKRFGLVTAKPPLAIRSFAVSAYWHRRNDAQPQLLWLLEQLKLGVIKKSDQ
jgi:DNA-binding transcriptional LysR family regulator